VVVRPEWVFSATGVHTLGIKGLLSYNANVDPPSTHRRLPRRRLAHNSAALHRTICQQFGEVPWDQNAITCTTTRSSLPLQIHEQAILAQFVLYLSKANNEYE